MTHLDKFPNRLLIISFVVLCAAATVVGWTLDAHLSQGTQVKERMIDRTFTRSSPVVEITEVKVSKKIVELGRAFDEDNDWPSKVSFRLKNVSSKPIVYLQVNVNFPETSTTGA